MYANTAEPDHTSRSTTSDLVLMSHKMDARYEWVNPESTKKKCIRKSRLPKSSAANNCLTLLTNQVERQTASTPMGAV